MFVRSSKYHEQRVLLKQLEDEVSMAKQCLRAARVERDRARRELQESNDDYLHRLLFGRIIIHTDQHSVEGVLTQVFPDSVSLRQATVAIAPGSVEVLEGEQIIPRSQIAWVQRLDNVRA